MGRTLSGLHHIIHAASEGDKFNTDTTLEVVSCPTCAIVYAIPARLKAAALRWHGDRENGWKLCCPLGHEWWYTGQTEKEKLQAKLKDERDRSGRLAAERDQTAASLRATKGVVTRQRKKLERVKNGVCPCCNRTFVNLGRHMSTKHPDFKPTQCG